VRLARDSGYFHFLEECGHDTRIALGDGRLSLQKAADRDFDLVVMDAFSSDAIPIHLLTREAVALYFEKLADHGLLLYHISNRHLELAPVLANIAADAGLVALRDVYAPPVGQEGQSASEWVVLARSSDDLAFLADDPRWAPLHGRPGGRPWTDDYSNLIGAIRR
jgi:spermidine synthase